MPTDYAVWTNREGRNDLLAAGYTTIVSARRCARAYCASDQREGAQYWVEALDRPCLPVAAPYVYRGGRVKIETLY